MILLALQDLLPSPSILPQLGHLKQTSPTHSPHTQLGKAWLPGQSGENGGLGEWWHP